MTDISGNSGDIIYIRYNNNYIQYAKNNGSYQNITLFPMNITNNIPTDYMYVKIINNLTISQINQYFSFLTNYIQIDGKNNTCFINCNYDGLIQNTNQNINVIVQNIKVDGTSGTLNQYCGWIGQQNFCNGIINNCSSNGLINISSGGIVGSHNISNINLEITNCYSTGDIGINDFYYGAGAGGIVGLIRSNININNIELNLNIINCYSTGKILIYGSSGIISGIYNHNNLLITLNTNIINCYSTNDISKSSGGIIGNIFVYNLTRDKKYSNILNAKIINSYSLGEIKEDGGGIIGSIINYAFDIQTTLNIEIINSYSRNIINQNAGGIIGALYNRSDGNLIINSNITNTYYNGNNTQYIGNISGSNITNNTITSNLYGYNSSWSDSIALINLDNTQNTWYKQNQNIPWILNSPTIFTTTNNMIYDLYDKNISSLNNKITLPLYNNLQLAIINIKNIEIGTVCASIADNCFQNGININTLTIDDSITLPSSLTIIGNNAFQNTNINLLTIPSSVTSIGNYAFNQSPLINIYVSSSNTNFISNNNVALINKTTNSLLQYAINNTQTTYQIQNYILSIANGAFQNTKYLTSVTIPQNITFFGDNSFNQCSSVTVLNLLNKRPSNSNIGVHVFSMCPINIVYFNNKSLWSPNIDFIVNGTLGFTSNSSYVYFLYNNPIPKSLGFIKFDGKLNSIKTIKMGIVTYIVVRLGKITTLYIQ